MHFSHVTISCSWWGEGYIINISHGHVVEMGSVSSKITTFGYYGCATFLTCTFLTWLLIAHNEGKDTWSILSHGHVGTMVAISSKLTTFGYYGCATFLTCTFFTWLLFSHNEGKDKRSILSQGVVGAMGQLSILFMDMIVTFLWLQSPSKSVSLWIKLIVLKPAYINEGGGGGRGPLIWLMSQNPCFILLLFGSSSNEVFIYCRLCITVT